MRRQFDAYLTSAYKPSTQTTGPCRPKFDSSLVLFNYLTKTSRSEKHTDVNKRQKQINLFKLFKIKSNQINLLKLVRSGCRSHEPKAHVSNVRAFRIELEFKSVGLYERGKPEYPEKNLSEQRAEPTTSSSHMITPSPGIEVLVTLVGGECSHHYTIPAPFTKCPVTKCPITKCPVTNCPLRNCPLTKCPLTNLSPHELSAHEVSPDEVCPHELSRRELSPHEGHVSHYNL